MTAEDADTVMSPDRESFPLLLAGHGTRDPSGVAECLALADRVRSLLPHVRVEPAFVELTAPSIERALETILSDGHDGVVVVPLMIGAGGHVRHDIPQAMEAGRRDHENAKVVYSRHLGAPPGMVSAALQRIDSARDDWDAADVGLVVVGRGCSVADANADHTRLTRLLQESG
ncbi:MAG TPA: CbiX/SirB N-terminal domain-containing protein, partial [Propionibacteriaceae bacterium]|nr:CbiX/SirB N-terminal domain-containing protein [Propionibacteriaceae bacterium]